MEHITTEYGAPCNLLTLKSDDYYDSLEPFLLALGIRARVTMAWMEDGTPMVKIQAENPYKSSLQMYRKCGEGVQHALDMADMEMEPFHLSCYKR